MIHLLHALNRAWYLKKPGPFFLPYNPILSGESQYGLSSMPAAAATPG
jgi:hypothetical protein